MTDKSDMVNYQPDERIYKDYFLKRFVGQGAFGRVFLVKNEIGKSFALNILPFANHECSWNWRTTAFQTAALLSGRSLYDMRRAIQSDNRRACRQIRGGE